MAAGTCETCGDDYPITRRGQPDHECPRCESAAFDEALDAYDGIQFTHPVSRREQMRERLGVSGDVDE